MGFSVAVVSARVSSSIWPPDNRAPAIEDHHGDVSLPTVGGTSWQGMLTDGIVAISEPTLPTALSYECGFGFRVVDDALYILLVGIVLSITGKPDR
jgi:hypothetical protein